MVTTDDFEVLVHLMREYLKSQCCADHGMTKLVYALCAACATLNVDPIPYAKMFLSESMSLKQHVQENQETIQ